MMAPRFDNQCFHLAFTALFICLVMSKSSSARPLLISRLAGSTAAAAAEEVGENSLLTVEKLATHDHAHQQQQVGGILGDFVMNVLPRGITPPSGPSRRNNGVKT